MLAAASRQGQLDCIDYYWGDPYGREERKEKRENRGGEGAMDEDGTGDESEIYM